MTLAHNGGIQNSPSPDSGTNFSFGENLYKKKLLTFYKYLVTDYLSLSYTILKVVIGFKYKQKAPRDIFKTVNAMEPKPLNTNFMT